MRIVEWSAIKWQDTIPPMGKFLRRYLSERKPGSESYAVWNLLYKTLMDNGLEIGEVGFTSTGKPYFVNSNIYFSLSHSSGICAVSIADVPTGIDVEKTDRKISDSVLKKVLSEDEYRCLKEYPVTGWCKKEAASKIEGDGLLESHAISIIDPNTIEFAEYDAVVAGIKYKIVSGYLCGEI